MGKVTASFSSTAPASTVEYTVVCATPEELVDAINNRTARYCHYFDEDGNSLYLEEALEILGISPEYMQEFKKANGFFYNATPGEIAHWQRQSRIVRVVLAIFCILIVLGIAWKIGIQIF